MTTPNGDMSIPPREANVGWRVSTRTRSGSREHPTPCSGDSGGAWISGGVLVGLTHAGGRDCTQFGNASRISGSLDWINSVIRFHYTFTGFFQPVDGAPTVNSLKAGGAVPVKFSLAGDQGVNVLADGYPQSERIDCDSSEPADGIEETVTAGSSSLSYDPSTTRTRTCGRRTRPGRIPAGSSI